MAIGYPSNLKFSRIEIDPNFLASAGRRFARSPALKSRSLLSPGAAIEGGDESEESKPAYAAVKRYKYNSYLINKHAGYSHFIRINQRAKSSLNVREAFLVAKP